MAVVVKPLAKIPDTEQQPHLVEGREDGPIRCKRCKCYMCPGFGFIDGGRRFQCHLCCAITDVSGRYNILIYLYSIILFFVNFWTFAAPSPMLVQVVSYCSLLIICRTIYVSAAKYQIGNRIIFCKVLKVCSSNCIKLKITLKGYCSFK